MGKPVGPGQRRAKFRHDRRALNRAAADTTSFIRNANGHQAQFGQAVPLRTGVISQITLNALLQQGRGFGQGKF